MRDLVRLAERMFVDDVVQHDVMATMIIDLVQEGVPVEVARDVVYAVIVGDNLDKLVNRVLSYVKRNRY